MAGHTLTSDFFVAQVNALAKPCDVAFPHNGRSHVYTGPSRWIYKNYTPLNGSRIKNGERAEKRAKADDEFLITDSLPGKYLHSFHVPGMKEMGVYAYFEEILGFFDDDIQKEGDRPWIRLSKLFIRSLWGRVSTTVCGADRKRIFYTLELPYMMVVIPQLIEKMKRTKDIDFINDFPTKIFRTAFSAASYEKTYKLICLTERRKAFRRGLESGKVEDYADYLDTLEISVLDFYKQSKTSKHPLNANVPEDERLAWKQAAMETMARKSLGFIEAELGLKPKKIVIMPTMPQSLSAK